MQWDDKRNWLGDKLIFLRQFAPGLLADLLLLVGVSSARGTGPYGPQFANLSLETPKLWEASGKNGGKMPASVSTHL